MPDEELIIDIDDATAEILIELEDPEVVVFDLAEVSAGEELLEIYINEGEPDRVYGESPIGLRNGVNATFYTKSDYIPETVEVFIFGKLTIIEDYQLIGPRQIQLVQQPFAGEPISVNYTKLH
jgi:hypothetical protein